MTATLIWVAVQESLGTTAIMYTTTGEEINELCSGLLAQFWKVVFSTQL